MLATREAIVAWSKRLGKPVGAALLIAFLAVPEPRTAVAPSAFVRVDLVGYPREGAKRAYLLSPVLEREATFDVRNEDGTTVYSASIGPSLGAWSDRYPQVHALDFDAVTTEGSYTIVVQAETPATSPSFRIGPAADLYAVPLANGLSFYRNQRDGSDFIRTALRKAPAHLNDARASAYLTPAFNHADGFKGDLLPVGLTMDASGGWADAGDYLKFVETHSYTVALVLVGVRDFPDQMGAGSKASDFTDEARFGLDWLLKMWDEATRTLYYQVGIAEGNARTLGDHDLWRMPQDDDTYGGSSSLYRYIRSRPVLRAATPGSPISPNLAGRLAADFALGFRAFKAIDPGYADRCLVAAETVFDLADAEPQGRLLTAGPFDFYPETEWRDDLELGATELYFAVRSGDLPPGLPHSDPKLYLEAAAHWASEYLHGPGDATDTLNLYDVSGLAHYELHRAISLAGNPSGLEVSKRQLLADLTKQLDTAVTRAESDPFGFGFPWSAYDSVSHGAGLSVMASEVESLTGRDAYSPYARRWLSNILGANAWGSSFIVGDGAVFPSCMQHQVANLAGSLDASPPLLLGAVVEGPNSYAARGLADGMRRCPPSGGDEFAGFNGSGAVYQDNVQSYSTVEPAIDLGAAVPLAFSWRVARAERPRSRERE